MRGRLRNACLLLTGCLCALMLMSADDRPNAAEGLAKRTLVVGIHNRAPWGYRDEAGEIIGYHPDILRAAMAPLGVSKLEFVVSDFSAMIPGLLANRIDVIASGVAITPTRCQQVLFGEPDLSGGDGLLVLKGNPRNIHSYADIAKNPDIKFGSGRGTEQTKNAMEAGIAQDRILLLPSAEALVSALMAGRIDAFTIGASTAATLMDRGSMPGVERAMPFTGYVMPDGREKRLATAIVFRPSDAALRDAYNVQLAKLKADGSLRKLMDKYKFTEAEYPPEAATADICAGKS